MSETDKLKLDLPALLPHVENERDQCLARLQDALVAQRGIDRVHFRTDVQPVQLCLHYDAARISPGQVRHLAQSAGATVSHRYRHVAFDLDGLDCGDCALVVEHGLSRLEGVLAAAVDYRTATLRVEFDSARTNRRAVLARVRDLGYGVRNEVSLDGWLRRNAGLARALASGLLLAAGAGLGIAGPGPVSLALLALAYLAGGYDLARHAVHAVRERRLDVDILMLFAALGAALLGDFAEGALLLFLFALGHALEHYAMDRARNAIQALGRLSPKTARVARAGQEIELPVERLQRGDVVVVRAGERIPVDGAILRGRSAVDQSPITGESIPLDKEEGDTVFAGTLNGSGALDVEVTKPASNTTLARVVALVAEAQARKSPTQRFTDRFEALFVPAVLGLAVALAILPPLLGVAPWSVSFYRALALLVAASPCALAIGTPAATLAAIAQAARNGVLIKGGAHLENLGAVDAMAFDKTGTLTRGKPEVTGVFPVAGTTEDELLALAAAVESRSTHPLAQAIVRAAGARGLTLPEAGRVESVAGRGLCAQVRDATVRIGSLKYLQGENVSVGDDLRARVAALESGGATTMLIARGDAGLGAIAMADTPRDSARGALARLHALGVRQTIMLTGDNAPVAAAMAAQVGVSAYRANLLPEDKAGAIRDLAAQYGAVAMVGDGVNDAPALAHATVGIAMGGAGTDVALESADIALMADDLAKLPFAVGLSRAARAIIRQNLALALGVIGLLVVTSVTGWISLGLAIFLHEGSTLAVVGNALRLLGYSEGVKRDA